jgi:hypothetical protein
MCSVFQVNPILWYEIFIMPPVMGLFIRDNIKTAQAWAGEASTSHTPEIKPGF